MPDQTRKNLEPIEESDLDLKDKFLGEKKTPEKVAKEDKETIVEKVPAPENLSEKKERKEGAAEKEEAYAKILSTNPTPSLPQDNQIASDADAANKEKDAESKINNLGNLAEIKGIPHAVKVARHMEDKYVLDEFHDKLWGEELQKALVEKGLIKEF